MPPGGNNADHRYGRKYLRRKHAFRAESNVSLLLDLSEPDHEESRTLRWYALRTRSRHEKVVRDQLTQKGIEQLLPTVKRLSQWKDRKKEIEMPLFSGYCFARFPWTDRLPVLQVAGVVNVVGSGHRPEPIPEEQIQSLMTLMVSTLPYNRHPYLHVGMPIEVARGPLKGTQGILVRKEKAYRLVISVHLIRQSAAVEIDASDIAPM